MIKYMIGGVLVLIAEMLVVYGINVIFHTCSAGYLPLCAYPEYGAMLTAQFAAQLGLLMLCFISVPRTRFYVLASVTLLVMVVLQNTPHYDELSVWGMAAVLTAMSLVAWILE